MKDRSEEMVRLMIDTYDIYLNWDEKEILAPHTAMELPPVQKHIAFAKGETHFKFTSINPKEHLLLAQAIKSLSNTAA